jgi:hypothetical protein
MKCLRIQATTLGASLQSCRELCFGDPVAGLNAPRAFVYSDGFKGQGSGIGVANPRRQAITRWIEGNELREMVILEPKPHGSGPVLLGFRGTKMEGVSDAL